MEYIADRTSAWYIVLEPNQAAEDVEDLITEARQLVGKVWDPKWSFRDDQFF